MLRSLRSGLPALIVLAILLFWLVHAKQPRPDVGLPVSDVSWPASTLVVA